MSSTNTLASERHAQPITTSLAGSGGLDKAVFEESIDMATSESTSKQPEAPSSPRNAAFSHLFVFWDAREAKLLIPAVLASALVAGAKVAFAIILGRVFDESANLGSTSITPDEALSRISVLCLVLTGLGAFKWLTSSLFMGLWITHGESRTRTVRKRVFQSLLNKPTEWFDSRTDGTAGIMTELQTQTRELQQGSTQILGHIVSDLFVCLGCIILAFGKGWELTLGLLASIPLSVFCLSLLGRSIEPATESQRQELNQAAKHATASLVAIDIVKVYNAYDQELWLYLGRVHRAMRFYLVQARCTSSQMAFVKFWMVILFVIGFWLGVYLVDLGRTTPGNVLTAFYAVLIAFQSVESLGTQWLTVVKGMTAGASMEAMTADSEGCDAPAGSGFATPEVAPKDIQLIDVRFAYPSNPNKTVLDKGNFFFPSGELSFIVGRSGSGKSTIADLLVKFYTPQSGKILIDGIPSEDLSLQWIREHVTLIQQSSTLFTGTFATNVALGSRNPRQITPDQVRWACQTAVLQSTLSSLPNGIDTMVGPRGHALSGGQRQRLALARPRLRDPSILILDEVTSGLDPLTAKMIMDAIREWRRNKTTIIITHDVSQMEDDDYVYVMDQGSVVQKGSYGRLVGEKGGFLDLMLQAGSPTLASPVRESEEQTIPARNEFEDRSIAERILAPRIDGQSVGKGVFKRMSLLAPISHGRPAPSNRSSEVPEFPGSNRSSLALVQQRGEYAQVNRPATSLARRGRSASIVPELPSPAPDRESQQTATLWSIFRTVWSPLNKFDRLWLVLGILACLVVAGLNPAFSFLFAKMLEAFWTTGAKEAAGRKWAIILIVNGCIDGLAVFSSFYLMDRVGQAWVDGLRTEAFKRVMRQPKEWFDQPKNSPSRIVECLDRNAEEMRKLVGVFVPILLVSSGMMLIAIVWAMTISWNLTLVALASGPVVVGLTQWASSVSDKWETRCNSATESTGAVFNEVFSNIRVVRALTLEEYFTEELEQSTAAAFKLGLSRSWCTAILYGVNQGIADWLAALAFYYGIKLLTFEGTQLTVGNITQVNNLLLFSIGTAAVMLGNIPQISAAKTVATKMLHYANLSLHASHELKGGIRATDIFPIKMTNLTIHPAEFLAIVSSSGSSKSTILSLLLRLYDAPLTFASHPATTLSTPSLRAHMTFVPQHPFLFPSTVAHNLTLGLHESSPLRHPDNYTAAARAAGIHDTVASLPHGYATRVGAGGLALSGGQAQRLCVARALARRARVLVLDEPTGALDAEAAAGVRRVLRRVVSGEGVAVVVVTHAREMMREADRVVAVGEGVVVAEGGFEELVRGDRRFAELVGGSGE